MLLLFVSAFFEFLRVMLLFGVGAFDAFDRLIVVGETGIPAFFAHAIFEKADSFKLGIHHFKNIMLTRQGQTSLIFNL